MSMHNHVQERNKRHLPLCYTGDHLQLRCETHLEQGEDMVHTSFCGDWTCWIIVTCRVVFGLAHLHGLDLAVVDNDHKALAPRIAKNSHWTWMLEHHANPPGEPALRISHEDNTSAFWHSKVLFPPFHHSTIVDAVNNYFINALALQLRESFHVLRHLHCGSAWCESTGQAQHNHLLALQAL